MRESKIAKEDYIEIKGSSWPEWEDFLTGKRTDDENINSEIELFVNQYSGMGKVFPIKTETSCLSKWSSSSLYLPMGLTASCCYADLLPLTVENFDDFHNHPKKIEDREKMIEGKWPSSGCQHCIRVERQGGFSERNDVASMRGYNPIEMEDNPLATHVTPSVIDIFTHNTCNFSCLYCSSNLSSQIEYENHKFGRFDRDGVVIEDTLPDKPDISAMFDKLVSWMDRNILNLKRLHLLGGETFLQHELLAAVFEILDKTPNPELELCMFSNMNAPEKYWKKYTDKVNQLAVDKKIKRFDLNASVDCWGPEASFVRSGLNLDLLDERMIWASKQTDWLSLHLTSTVTSMSIYTLDQLIAKTARYTENNPNVGLRFMFVSKEHRDYLHPEIFNYETWGDSFDRCYRELSKIPTVDPTSLQRLQGLEGYLKPIKHHNMKKVKKLHVYLDELDRRRGTDWRALFPYLDVNE